MAFGLQHFHVSFDGDASESEEDLMDENDRSRLQDTDFDDSEFEFDGASVNDYDACHPVTVRGVDLDGGVHAAPGTILPQPLPGDPEPDPLLNHPKLKKNKYYPFKNRRQWRWAFHHLVVAKHSDASLRRLRNLLQSLVGGLESDLLDAAEIRSQLNSSPFALPTKATALKDSMDRPYAFFHRDLMATIQDLVGRVHLGDKVNLSAKVEINTRPDGKLERVYSDLHTGDAWADAQIQMSANGKFLMLPLIISSNKTLVRYMSSMIFRGVNADPCALRLGSRAPFTLADLPVDSDSFVRRPRPADDARLRAARLSSAAE